MAKVNFNKLSLGQMLTPGAVWDNLDQCATALSGNISKDQREHNRSLFTFTLHRARCGYDLFSQESGNPFWDETTKKTLKFFLPPLQEYFSSSLVGDFNTPDIKLESVSLSFDGMNQQYPVDLTTGIPDITATFDQDLLVNIKSGNFVGQVTIPKVTLNISNEEIINRPNPTVSADIGAIIDPYSELELEITPPISDQNTYAASKWTQLKGIDSLVVHARFSAPIVQRDSAAYSALPQNSPLHDCARSAITNTLIRPTSGTVIRANTNGLDGVQEAFEQLDRQVRTGLRGGLTRWSKIRTLTESTLEDQGYFCITVPLFNVSQVSLTHDHAVPNLEYERFRNLWGYLRPSALRSVTALMDRAVIPIVAPGTIHHVGVFWDKTTVTSTTEEIKMDLGVAIGCGARAQLDAYTQVVQVAEKPVDFFGPTDPGIQNFFAPVTYSTHVSAPALGKGYVTQGRPFYFGQEIDMTGAAVRRRNVADAATPGNAEAAPSTNGTEQFIEIRCNLYKYDAAAAGYIDMTASPAAGDTNIGNWSGIVVCLYGKMALVE